MDPEAVAVLKKLSEQTARMERASASLMAGRAGKPSHSRGGIGRNVGLMALLVTLHTVVVATGTAVVVVGLLTGHPLMELVLRLVQ